MKIGILSIYLHTNYGGILQAYALQTYLKEMGHEAIIIDGGNYVNHSSVGDCFRIIHWLLVETKKGHWPNLHKCPLFNNHNLKRFIIQNMNLMKQHNIKDIKSENFDAIIVGSDQVWRKYSHIKDMAYYYLDFTSDWPIKRISYAASFGNDEWLYNVDETIRCSNMLNKFSGISVREFEGQSLCKKYLHAEAEVVIDPTLLLPKEHYLNFCHDCKSCSHNFLTYILDKDDNKHKSLRILEGILEQKAYEINRVNMFGQKPSIESWLACFKTAEFVFTDSFHGCVFSIIFNKPFIVYSNPIRGTSRFKTLLNLLDLQERMVSNPTEIDAVYNKSIDWNSVNKKIGLLRLQAKDFLIKSLS